MLTALSTCTRATPPASSTGQPPSWSRRATTSERTASSLAAGSWRRLWRRRRRSSCSPRRGHRPHHDVRRRRYGHGHPDRTGLTPLMTRTDPGAPRSSPALSRLPSTPEPMHRWDGGGGVTIAADSWGDPHGPLVLLLHGGGQTRHAWRGTGQRLGDAGYHAVAFDARGHGDSDWAPDGVYDQDAMVADVLRVFEALGAGRPVLVGASMGGGTGLVAVGENHVDATALVLVDVAPRIEPDGAEKIQAFMSRNGFASLEEVADAIAGYQTHRPRPASLDGLAKNLRLGDDGRVLLALGSAVPRRSPRSGTPPGPLGGVCPPPLAADAVGPGRAVRHPLGGRGSGVPRPVPACRVRQRHRRRAHGRRRPQRRVRRRRRRVPGEGGSRRRCTDAAAPSDPAAPCRPSRRAFDVP